MAKIKLINENGVIKGIDPETGEEVPVEFEDLETQSVSTEEASITQSFDIDHSENSLFAPRSFEQSGPVTTKPHPLAENPVLSSTDVTDVSSPAGVSDPFIVQEGGQFHMFFEVIPGSGDAVISHAVSDDGLSWTYDQVVLDTAYQLSYPVTVKWGGSWYMMPSNANGQFEIFKADSFPTNWSQVETALSPSWSLHDPTPFYHQGRWYALFWDTTNSQTRLYYADEGDSLTGRSWSEHPSSPILTESGDNIEGPAGKPITQGEYVEGVFRRSGGDAINIYRFTELTPSSASFSEATNSPIAYHTGQAGHYQAQNVHNFDVVLESFGGQPIVAVDGAENGHPNWEIGINTLGGDYPTAASVTLSADQSVGSGGGWTNLNFDTVNHDLGENFDTTANQFVVPVTGWYEVSLNLFWAVTSTSATSGEVSGSVAASGSNIKSSIDKRHIGVNNDITTGRTTRVFLQKGDTITGQAFQTSGASVPVQAGNSTLEIRRLSE
ncbi:glucosamine inositolphosphorylceramide transferase family protein [Halobacterium salinarum]|uniref:glucosamine inositolphosphorylceramide transferase family protein n=1 Tax=Halobacterium salinarum TaxID=2242 RepID=UPI0025544CF9|nr:hypothetical protein [Halobacterium salinarum]MDL0127055.1 hypothetical protein [Halobacterium salinarum]